MKLQGKWTIEIGVRAANDSMDAPDAGNVLGGCTEVELIPASPWIRFTDADGRVRLASGNLVLTSEDRPTRRGE